MLRVLIPHEEDAFETRVAGTPDSVKKLKALGADVFVQEGAGCNSFFSDADYAQAGAHVVPTLSSVEKSSSSETGRVLLAVNTPSAQQLDQLSAPVILIGLLGGTKVTSTLHPNIHRAFSLELLPRISRAQSMDVLASQSTIAGYGAVIEAAHRSPSLFPLLMTAGGTVPPAKVLVLGAGVAGLQAIATAKRLGAQVYALDVRPAAREQVESLGGVFVHVEAESGEDALGYAKEMGTSYQERQAQALTPLLPQMDVVLGTALIPGRTAPRILTHALMELLKPGAVVIDMAAASGGNCALSQPNQDVTTPGGVFIVGNSRLACHHPKDASRLYSRNLYEFVRLMGAGGEVKAPASDELLSATCIWDTDAPAVA